MYAARPLCRVLGVAPLGAAAAAVVVHRGRRRRDGVANWAEFLHAEDRLGGRFQELPGSLASQAYQPAVPYPGWDNNWDHCNLDQKAIARRLGHEWPVKNYPEAVRKLYTEHTDYRTDKVEKIIERNREDLPGLYKKAYLEHAYGGAAIRHIILVRHGQYDEQRELARRLQKEGGDNFGLPGDTKYVELDEARVLTDLGRRQAEKAGDRLAELLKPALSTPGREADVRIHVSTLKRARETADIIASRLPDHVTRVEPNNLLVEGDPPAHTIPYESRGGEAALLKRSRDVHIEGARMEAGFRSLFYRGLPCQKEGDSQKSSGGSRRHEYEIVVCHMNLIRYFTLRALQLPPEAWLRFAGYNGSFTHLKVRPGGTVSLQSFGDAGYLSFEEITFGQHEGLE